MDMYLIDEIVSIEDIDCDSLRYDITVADNSNFFANDILVHNCQNLTNEWPDLKKYFYERTEKLEGSSMTVARIDGEFIVCSRNLNLKETEGNTFWKLARQYDIEQKMITLEIDNLAIQGEAIGEGIEGNHYALKGHDFYVYTIYDIGAGQYVSPNLRIKICYSLGLKHVPVIDTDYDVFHYTIDSVLEMSDGLSKINPNKMREGIVYKRVDGQEHFKAVSNSYLLKRG
jgi:RNA ligase (TIGR02306 family)